MKTILVTAYAVNPYKGSENGMGWRFIDEIAKGYKVIAITRENNIPHVEKYLKEFPADHHQNMQFVGYDLPKHLRFWKRGGFGSLPYFYLWQRTMPAFIRRQGWAFDIAHNLNFHNDWMPSFLGKLGKPFIWGPIGHHPLIPKAYLKGIFPYKELLKDRFRWAIKQAFWRLSPSLKRAARTADVIFAMNKSVGDILPLAKDKICIMPSAGTEYVSWEGPSQAEGFEVLSVGRFVSLKGFDVTIRSFAAFVKQLGAAEQQRARLTLIGQGPYWEMLEQLAVDLGIADKVRFVAWVDRAELDHFYRTAHLFFFPSHEGAGMVVPEAFSYGLPVLCFDNCGPGEFVTDACGITVPYGQYHESVTTFAAHLKTLHADTPYREGLAQGARKRFLTFFDWAAKGKMLRAVYQEVLDKD